MKCPHCRVARYASPHIVIRLPVQHRQSPHCPKCQRVIDTLDNVHLDLFRLPEDRTRSSRIHPGSCTGSRLICGRILPHVDFSLEAVTFHARCVCVFARGRKHPILSVPRSAADALGWTEPEPPEPPKSGRRMSPRRPKRP